MSGTHEEQAALMAVLEQIIDKMQTHGWAVMGTADDDGPFSYTVGLTQHRVPELIVENLPPHEATLILNDLARRHTQIDPFTHGQVTQVGGRIVRFDARQDLDRLVFVRQLYQDNNPVPPTALTITFTPYGRPR